MPTIRCSWLLAATLALSGCMLDSQQAMLPDTLYFSPGTPIEYRGQSAKLYGTEQCVQGVLSGHSCLIFPPHRPTSKAIVISGEHVQEVQVTAQRDPQNPLMFVVVDPQGRRLLSTSGTHDNLANISIAQ